MISDDLLGNRTEETIKKFLVSLDKSSKLGPKPISGVTFNKYSISDVVGCTDEIAEKLLKTPVAFQYDELDQVFIEVESEEGGEKERFYLTSDSSDPTFESTCQTISKNLPDVPYDLECEGYASRQAEAAALYKIAIINKLQEGQYDADIESCLSRYDFHRWVGANGNYVLTELLQKIQEEADSISRIVLMVTNNKLISDKVKKNTSYKGFLKAEDAERLRLLAEEDARINFSFNKLYESATTSREKIEIGEKLAEARKEMLSANYVTDELNILFTIYSLNQNAIPGRAKRIIRNEASKYVESLTQEGSLTNLESAIEFKKKLIQRAQKLFLSRMKEIRYKLWSDRTPDTDLSSLIPKF